MPEHYFFYNIGLGFLLVLLPGIAAAFIADRKGRNIPGWAFMCIIFPVAIIVLLILDSKKKKRAENDYAPCPYCKEMIKKDAVMCRFCRMPVRRD